ncbi:hypothetical protein [Parafrankia sp. BMG5.11]|uniref:hypothetical protein n=1 Tax=Parafrankia sp. BMG5.11 TaxID=222540 RepID=UPI00103C865C|nr:hypothetical protein [Parafrankia sp. BMG5.11]TCJ35792.1 hypothetical protein E0504_26195 [Parafrankia sp. BMG5.11]
MTDTDADPGFELRLRATMTSAARIIHQPPGLAQHVIERGRRHRRRKALTAAVALAVAAVGAVVVPQVLPEKKSAMYPADTSILRSPLDTVYGVDVHWLPDGYGVRSREAQNLWGSASDLDRFQIVTTYNSLPTTARFAPHQVRDTPESRGYTVAVGRGPDLDLEARMRRITEAIGEADVAKPIRAADVRGHPTYTYAPPAHGAYTGEDLTFWLTWSPEPAVVLTVWGPSEADTRRIAESLVVGPEPDISPDPGQSLQVEQVVHGAFTTGPGTDPQDTLDRVEGGEGLRTSMDGALRTNRELLESIRVASTGPVTFLNETEAVLAFQVEAQEQAVGGVAKVSWYGSVRVIRTADGWKVRKQDYCASATWLLTYPPVTIS